jgi:hypothetical protein
VGNSVGTLFASVELPFGVSVRFSELDFNRLVEMAQTARYGLRYSFATMHRRAGADLADEQEMLGHTTPRVTQRYAHVSPEKLPASAHRTEVVWRQARGEFAWVKPHVIEKKAAYGTD